MAGPKCEKRFGAGALVDDFGDEFAWRRGDYNSAVFCSVKVSTRSLGRLDLYLGLPESLRYQVNDVIFDLQGAGDP